MTLRLLSLLFCTISNVFAEGEFHYYVSSESNTGKLHIEHIHDVSVDDVSITSPRLTFSTGYIVHGCLQERFTYTTERCEMNISRDRLDKLLAEIREFPLHSLPLKKLDSDEFGTDQGYGVLDGDVYSINASLNRKERARLRNLVLAFVDEVAPKPVRKSSRHTVEGDLVPARALNFEAVLREPEKFDGKRVRLTGYYHAKFEGSTFGPRKGADYPESVWLGGDSTFATPSKVERPSDRFITVEGIFQKGPSGHMGIFPGEIDRVMRIKEAIP